MFNKVSIWKESSMLHARAPQKKMLHARDHVYKTQNSMYWWRGSKMDSRFVSSPTWDSEINSGGWDFTIRNDLCNLVAAGTGYPEHVSCALHAEALAMLHAINATARMGCSQIILETDSMVLKQVVSTQDCNSAALGSLFQEIKLLMLLN